MRGKIGWLRRTGRVREAAVLMLLCGMIVPTAGAQRRHVQKPATLSGIVLGPDDKPVAYASITYQSSAGREPHAVYTDRQGKFTISKLKPDNYDLRASANGVFSEWQKNVSLHSGESMYLTLQLIYERGPVSPKTGKKTKPGP